jgi:hypothetical protein
MSRRSTMPAILNLILLNLLSIAILNALINDDQCNECSTGKRY